MSQSRKRSLAETCTGTFTGLVGSWLICLFCIKTWSDPYAVVTMSTLLCTVWSIVRGYTIRRIFNKADRAIAQKVN